MKEMDNISRIMIEAEAAGFGPHYGAYIAWRDGGKPSQTKEPKLYGKTKVCADMARLRQSATKKQKANKTE